MGAWTVGQPGVARPVSTTNEINRWPMKPVRSWRTRSHTLSTLDRSALGDSSSNHNHNDEGDDNDTTCKTLPTTPKPTLPGNTLGLMPSVDSIDRRPSLTSASSFASSEPPNTSISADHQNSHRFWRGTLASPSTRASRSSLVHPPKTHQPCCRVHRALPSPQN